MKYIRASGSEGAAMKVPFFHERIRHTFYAVLTAISVVTSILFVFVDIDPKYKAGVGIGALALLVVIYVGIWVYLNRWQSIRLKINASEVEVKFGDIFAEAADLKAIAFNEYFDTQIDDKIIARSSLHGMFIERFFKDKVDTLDGIIAADTHLSENIVGENTARPAGKKTRYKLGTICPVDDFLLIAFSRFDDSNRAYLEMQDYINCLLTFWNEVDRVYAGKTVALPVLGSGITRFRAYDNISDQELLELIIWTFKVSRVKFTYPSKVKIVVYQAKSDKINLLDLKDLET